VFRATLRSLLARKLRLALSAFAIVLGVAFVAGTFVFTDTLGDAFDGIVKGGTGDVVVQVEDAGDPADPSGAADARTIPADVIDGLAQAEGAARVDGNLTVGNVFVVGKDGKPIGGTGPPSFAVNYNDAPAITGEAALQIVAGEPPDAAGEVVIDDVTAERAGYQVGDTVPLLTASEQPRMEAELVGITEFGGGSLAGASLSVFDTAAMQEAFFDGREVYTDAWVTAAEGVGQEELRDQVAPLLPDGVIARTGDEVAEEEQNEIAQALEFVNTFLLVFALVALVVGSFLIINTFSILVAQRSRELALLRALGAGRRQVTRSVLLEAGVVGLLGSTLGLGLGFLLAVGLKALFGLFGLDLSGTGLSFAPRTAVVAYAVGMVVTLLAAYLPARRASRIAPVAALRDDVALPEQSIRRRSVVGTVLVALGAALMAAGLLDEGGRGAALVGGGVLAVLIGVALLSPVLGRPVLSVIGRLYRPLGTVGVLATQNALRNPRRTAATASALMIGLALVSTMSVLGASTNASIDKTIDESLVADYVVSNAIGSPFSPSVADDIADVEGVAEVTPFRYASAKLDERDAFIAATDPLSFTRVFELTMAAGSLENLQGGSVALTTVTADSLGVEVGDSLQLEFPSGPQDLTVVATYERNPALVDYLVPLSVFDDAQLELADSYVYVLREEGASPAAVYNAINEVVADLPTVTLKDQEQFKAEQREGVNQILYVIYALLGLAVVIAVLGIVNTLALSVIERTREVGLLRAVGLSRRQLQRMVRLESIAIAVLGAVLGVVMGIVFGVVLQQAIADQGIEVLSIPFGRLLFFVLLAAVVGVLAAVLPARRAARLDVLRAITTE